MRTAELLLQIPVRPSPADRNPQWNWHKIDPSVYLGRLPRSAADVMELVHEGIGAIVTLNESWELHVPSGLYAELGVDWLHLPTPDYFSPAIKDIQLGAPPFCSISSLIL